MIFKEYVTTKNVVFVILVIIILKFLSLISGITLLFFASYVIACSLNPIVDKLEKKMNRPLSVTIVMLGTFVVSIAFFVPIIVVAFKQIQGFISILPRQLDLLQDFIINHRFFGYKLHELVNFDALLKSSSSMATGIVNQSINLTIGIFQGVIFLLAICMIVFYFLIDKKTLKEGFIRFFPEKMKDKARYITANISHKVGGYVIAQLLSMFAVGLLTAIGLFILKIDYALLLGLITGVLDIIPIIGPTIALILCLLITYQMGPLWITLVIVMFLSAQWIAANLVRPIVFGKFLDLHPLVIIFALLVCGQFLGVWGVILAPALAATVCVLFDELYLKPVNKSK